MDEDASSKDEPSNPCCLDLKEKYTKLKEGRNALRQGIRLLEQQLAKVHAENASLKKAYEDERTKADREKENKDKEFTRRASLEAEISTLKSEILSLNQCGGQVAKAANQELECFRGRVSEYETEINRLKEIVEKERARADIEKTKAQAEKKKADESAKKLQAERSKVNDHKSVADMERKRAEELKSQVKVLQSAVEEAKSKLALEKEKLKDAENMLTAEKERIATERKSSVVAVAKVEEQRKVAMKQAMDEKNRAIHMSEQLDKTTQRLKEIEKQIEQGSSGRLKQASAGNELIGQIASGALKRDIHENDACRRLEKVRKKMFREKKKAKSERKKVKEQKQVAKKYKKAAMEEKLRADQLAYELQRNKKRMEDIGKEIQKLLLPQVVLKSFPHVSSQALMEETPELKLLSKRLKLEKLQLKHAKQIAEMEIGHSQLLRKETFQLKQELLKFSQRLETLDDHLRFSYGDVDDVEKLRNLKLEMEHFGVEACGRRLGVNGFAKTSCATSSGTFASALVDVEPTVSRLSGGTRKGSNEKLASKAEKNDKSHIKQTASKRRKRLRDALEPVETLDCVTRNFQPLGSGDSPFLQSMSNHQVDKHLDEIKLLATNEESDLWMKQAQYNKKMKSSSRNSPDLSNSCAADELKTNPETVGVGRPHVVVHASSAVGNLTALTHVGNDVLDQDISQNKHLPKNFDNIFDGYMLKMLDLDNDGDEERYRKAIQRPLSPILPLVEFQSTVAHEMVVSEDLSLSSYEEIMNVKEDLAPYSSFDVIGLEIDANSRNSLLPVTRFCNVRSENLHKNDNNDQNIVHCKSNHPRILNAGTSSSVPGEQGLIDHSETPTCGAFLKYCVVSSENSDNCSISRIYHTASCCLTEFVDSASTNLQNNLPLLGEADELSSKERASVFFSVLLHYISDIAKADLGEKFNLDLVQFLDFSVQKIWTALSDASSRRMLLQMCHLHDLFFLIDDFLLNGRVVMNGYMPKQTNVGCPSVPKGATDSCLSLSVEQASIHLLIAGGVVLASLCAATDNIGFLVEVSVNLFRTRLNSWVIKLLHIFGYICGSRYFKLEDHILEIRVLKCLVVLLEEGKSLNHSAACDPCIFRHSSNNSSCGNCPFADGVASVDDIAIALLEKLREYATAIIENSHPRSTSNLSNDGWLLSGMGNNASPNVVDAHSSYIFCDDYMLRCVDILSLLELVACLMSWDWTHHNIVTPLLQMLESSVPEDLSVSLVILVGQLGRLGVDAKGSEDSGIEALRDWLCARISCGHSGDFGLHVQFAAVTSLVGLVAMPFEEIVGSDSDPPGTTSQPAASKCIRKWFSSLDPEQKSLFRIVEGSTKKR